MASRASLTTASAFLTARVMSGAIQVLTFALFYRMLGAYEFGRYTVLLLFGAALFSLLYQWWGLALLRVGLSSPSEGEKLSGIFRSFAASSWISLIVISLLASTVTSSIPRTAPLLVATLAVTQGLFDLRLQDAVVRSSGREFLLLHLLRALTLLIFGTGIAAWVSTAEWLTIASSISFLVPLAALRATRPRVPTFGSVKEAISVVIHALRYGMPLSTSVLVQSLGSALIRSAVIASCGAAVVGYFAGPTDIILAVFSAVLISLNSQAFPLLSKSFDAAARAGFSDAFKLHLERILSLSLLLAMGAWIFREELLIFLLGIEPTKERLLVVSCAAISGLLIGARSCGTDTVLQLLKRSPALLINAVIALCVGAFILAISPGGSCLITLSLAMLAAHATQLVLSAAQAQASGLLPTPRRVFILYAGGFVAISLVLGVPTLAEWNFSVPVVMAIKGIVLVVAFVPLLRLSFQRHTIER